MQSAKTVLGVLRENGVGHWRATYAERRPRGSEEGRAEKDLRHRRHLAARPILYVSLSTHPARAILPSSQYDNSQCANSRGARFRTIASHFRARLLLRFSRLYLFIAQRTSIRSMRLQSDFTAVE
jgi:hypothetical protein